jgi:hypothetical protein
VPRVREHALGGRPVLQQVRRRLLDRLRQGPLSMPRMREGRGRGGEDLRVRSAPRGRGEHDLPGMRGRDTGDRHQVSQVLPTPRRGGQRVPRLRQEGGQGRCRVQVRGPLLGQGRRSRVLRVQRDRGHGRQVLPEVRCQVRGRAEARREDREKSEKIGRGSTARFVGLVDERELI